MGTSGSGNGRYFETNRVNPRNLYSFENISSRRMQRYQTLEIRRSWNSDDVISGFHWIHFSGVPRPIRIYMLFLISSKYLRHFKAIIGSLPVKKKFDNSKTKRVDPIYLYIFETIPSRQIQWYQTWRGSTKLKIWWRHFRFSMHFFFSCVACHIPIDMLSLI